MSRYDNATALRLVNGLLPELVYGLEIGFCAVGVIMLTFVVLFLIRIAPFHINFRIIIVDFCITYACCSLIRIVICVFYLQRRLEKEPLVNPAWIEVLQTIRDICIYGDGLDLFAAFVERTLASYHADNYELNGRVELPVVLLLLKHFIATVIIILYSVCIINSIAPSIFMTILNCITVIGFLRLRFVNHAKYCMDQQSSSTNVTLSHRYQLSENIRSYRFLIPVATMAMIGSCFGIGIYVSIHYINNLLFRTIMGEGFSVMISAGTTVMPLIAAVGYKSLCGRARRSFKVSWSKRSFYRLRPGRVGAAKEAQDSSQLRIHNVNGENLIVNSQQMSAVYFTQLQQQWM